MPHSLMRWFTIGSSILFARCLCGLWYIASVVVLLGCIGAEGSRSFIGGLPLIFYGIVRFGLFPSTVGKLLILSLILISAPLLLMLPSVRKRMAEHYSARSIEMIYTRDITKALQFKARAYQWDIRTAELEFERQQKMAKTAVRMQEEAKRKAEIDSLYKQARNLAKKGSFNEEVALYKRILELEPDHAEANYCMAMHYATRESNRNLALKHLRVSYQNLPEGNVWKRRCKELMDEMHRATQ